MAKGHMTVCSLCLLNTENINRGLETNNNLNGGDVFNTLCA